MTRLRSENYKSYIVNPGETRFCELLQSGTPPPRLITDWEEEYQKRLKLYEFRSYLRGGNLDPEEVDELLAMKFHKDYLYSKWIKDELDEDAERQKLKDLGYFQGENA
jgi:hypothetical protein